MHAARTHAARRGTQWGGGAAATARCALIYIFLHLRPALCHDTSACPVGENDRLQSGEKKRILPAVPRAVGHKTGGNMVNVLKSHKDGGKAPLL